MPDAWNGTFKGGDFTIPVHNMYFLLAVTLNHFKVKLATHSKLG